jgi:cbb3-type cytochrome oxidase cytochrome c subunit
MAVRARSVMPSFTRLLKRKSKLREIAVQMAGLAVLVGAEHAALEDAAEAFQRVDANIPAHNVVLEGQLQTRAFSNSLAQRYLEQIGSEPTRVVSAWPVL